MSQIHKSREEEAFEELNCRLEAIEGQRNRALADHAIVAGKLSMLGKKYSELAQRLAESLQETASLKKSIQEQKPTTEPITPQEA